MQPQPPARGNVQWSLALRVCSTRTTKLSAFLLLEGDLQIADELAQSLAYFLY
jgi:hypothetical protein